jgi:hypothetical protein
MSVADGQVLDLPDTRHAGAEEEGDALAVARVRRRLGPAGQASAPPSLARAQIR